MTDQTPDAPLGPQELAEEIMALTVLKDAVIIELDARRALVAAWTPGTKHTAVLPNETQPNKPRKVGEVRCDGGAVTARIKDREVWEKWVGEHAPHNLVVQAAQQLRWALDNESMEAVSDAVVAAQAVGDPNDPWSVADPSARAQAFLNALELAGYTLAKSVPIPERRVVMPNYEQETLKISKDAGTPVAPGGELPEGIEVETAPGKPYVTVGKDDDMRLEFLSELFDRGRVPQIAGVTPTPPTREEH